MRVAIVQEWLVTLGGSELVLRELLRMFPNADVFTLVDKMPSDDRRFLGVDRTTTTFLNSIPGIASHYRTLLPLFPAAIRSLDVRGYDIVISNSHAVAKGIRTHGGQLHVCYCLSPMRYAWDLRDQYLRESGLDTGLRGVLSRTILRALKEWDRANTKDVDVFATLSRYIGERIQRAYGRSSTVIYPPVDTEFFTPRSAGHTDEEANLDVADLGEYYVTASCFVPYKRVDIIAQAFASLGDRRLVIVGNGPDAAKVRGAAGRNVVLAGRVNRERLRALLRTARAFVFAAEEDFGIAPVEAQACGIPVIAFGKGGSLETVHGGDGSDRTGLFFHEQTPDAIAAAVLDFEALQTPISAAACRANAERFSEERFRSEMGALVDQEWRAFASRESLAPR